MSQSSDSQYIDPQIRDGMNLLEAHTSDSDLESSKKFLYTSSSDHSSQPVPLQVIYPKGFSQPTTSTKKKSVSKHTSQEKTTKPNVIILDSEENSEVLR